MADHPIVDVAIIGGGPAGAATALLLARRGASVVILERSLLWRWHAAGVFASPAAMDALRRLDVPEPTLVRVARPIPALRLETRAGATVRLTYGHDQGGAPAVGFDRSALDPALLGLAHDAGAIVRRGVTVLAVRAGDGRRPAALSARGADGLETVHARVVVGADGPHSILARAVGVGRTDRLPARVGLSHHRFDLRPDSDPIEARMRLLPDGYVGIAPVPGGRMNLGIVLGPSWRPVLAADGARRLVERIERDVPSTSADPAPWRTGEACDALAGTSPLGGRVSRRAGPGWFLVGDAAGFLDPFSGEGMHRALVSAELGAAGVAAALGLRMVGPVRKRDPGRAADAYDRAMHRRFATKDAVSRLVQTFLAQPALLEYAARRLATRPGVRATMGLVMGDLVPASHGLDPRFLARVLAP